MQWRNTEKTSAVLEPKAPPAAVDTQQPEKQAAAGHGRNGASAFTGANRVAVAHATLQPGDPCPECKEGRVYRQMCIRDRLYHMGLRGKVARSTLGDANETHDWRIYADFAQVMIGIARPLHARDPIGVDLSQSLYALDSTTIDLCLSLFPWAKFRKHKAAVKVHTLLDLHGNIPTFISITDGKVHDVNILDEIMPEAGAFYVMDLSLIHI